MRGNIRTRVSGTAGTAVAAGIVLTAMLAGGTVTLRASAAVVANAPAGVCGANRLCPNDPAPPSPPDLGDQPTAEQRVIEGYTAKQHGCTPDTPPNPQSVTWDPPGFTPSVGGSGNVTDANPQLGGPFRADWVNGRWHIDYLYC
jgi:hypothetical protein